MSPKYLVRSLSLSAYLTSSQWCPQQVRLPYDPLATPPILLALLQPHQAAASLMLLKICPVSTHFIFLALWLLHKHPFLRVCIACKLFSFIVHHSKFSTQLFSLFPSLWFTVLLFSRLGIKHVATNLCTLCCGYSFPKPTTRYPYGVFDCFSILPLCLKNSFLPRGPFL